MRFVRQGKADDVDVNITPLIDVVFLLLIFFMVSTTFTKETRVNINLPEAQGEASDNEPKALEITISATGEYAINGQALLNNEMDTLKAAMKKEANGKRLPVMISADAKTSHQSVITAMDVAGQLGFIQISMATMKPESK